MEVYTIKGLYYGKIGEEKNPTYYGTLQNAIRYANNSHFIHYGEDVKICVGNCVVAIQKWNKKVDEIGEYYEAEDWKIINQG